MNNEEKILDLLTQMNDRFDKVDNRLERMDSRMEHMDSRLEQVVTDLSTLKTEVVSIRLDIENRIDPQLQILAEGQHTILETLAPKNRVEALEDEMAFMKSVVRALSQRLDELQQAQ